MSYEGTAGGTRTITAFFDSRTDADEAVEALVNAGISRSQVRMVAGNEGGTTSSSSSSTYSSSNEGGFWDSLKDLFLPEEDRYTYAEGLNRGGYLVTATVSDAHYETALDILDDEGTIDMNERESSWRSEGWSGYSGASSTSGLTGMARGGSLESGGLATGSGRNDLRFEWLGYRLGRNGHGQHESGHQRKRRQRGSHSGRRGRTPHRQA
jgi:hypothetical protein